MEMFFSYCKSLAQNFMASEQSSLDYVSYGMLIFGGVSFVMLHFLPSPYGRYGSKAWGCLVNVKFAWLTQELPSFVIPCILTLYADCPQLKYTPNKILLGLFLLHYLQRTFLYPLLIRGGKPSPFLPYIMAVSFCVINGYLQARNISYYSVYPANWSTDPRFLFGIGLFLTGMGINLHSDHILRNLRKPGETGYKIPRGGMFEFVSAANFLGESVEWLGFACANWNLPALAFACFTFLNLAPRAMQHHRWYKQKFEDYPSHRTAIIPYLLQAFKVLLSEDGHGTWSFAQEAFHATIIKFFGNDGVSKIT